MNFSGVAIVLLLAGGTLLSLTVAEHRKAKHGRTRPFDRLGTTLPRQTLRGDKRHGKGV